MRAPRWTWSSCLSSDGLSCVVALFIARSLFSAHSFLTTAPAPLSGILYYSCIYFLLPFGDVCWHRSILLFRTFYSNKFKIQSSLCAVLFANIYLSRYKIIGLCKMFEWQNCLACKNWQTSFLSMTHFAGSIPPTISKLRPSWSDTLLWHNRRRRHGHFHQRGT